jgi:hypothetical protein
VGSPLLAAGKLADEGPFFFERVDLSLKLLLLRLEVFGSHLELRALGLGLLMALPPPVATDLQILESAFEQLEFILGLLAFRFPLVAARLEECHQFPQGT